jgi:NhaP-type Na+/H+ and K+/H+ antiporter
LLGVCAALVGGAVLGNAFGQIIDRVIPGATEGPGAFALVGMAAVFAGAARAPFTAILIAFEMTDDYRLIVLLMAGVIGSELVAERLHQDSICTLKAVFVDLTLVEGLAAFGKTIAELNLPHGVVMVAIRRGRELVLPNGDTRLQARYDYGALQK